MSPSRPDVLKEEVMIIRSVELETVCGITSRLPENERPEFAFAGKSNVGKSSLINALMNRKSLARTSAQPGKTQTINFYNINGELYYVDLPGYGYAKVPLAEKEKWGKMIENYLHRSRMLKCVFLLVDIRHEPSANDRMMYEWMVHNGFRPVIIATKLDKINRSQTQKQVRLIRTGLGMEKEDLLFPFSAQTKQGREEIWDFIEKMTSGDGQGEEAPKRELESKTEEKQGLGLQQRFHNMGVDLLAAVPPVAAHDLRLLLIGNGNVQADQDGLSLPDLAVDDIVLAGGSVIVGGHIHLVAEPEPVFL